MNKLTENWNNGIKRKWKNLCLKIGDNLKKFIIFKQFNKLKDIENEIYPCL